MYSFLLKIPMKNNYLLLNSSLMFVSATLWQQCIHELAHFLTAYYVGSPQVIIYHNYVDHSSENLSSSENILIAAAGPIMSLILGIIFHFICYRIKRRDWTFQFLLYLSVFGYINFGGYLMIAPFFVYGDTGFVFNQLGFSPISVYLFSATGILFLFFIIKFMSPFFSQMANYETIMNHKEKNIFLKNTVIFPLFIGIILTTILNLPVPSLLSLLYPLFSPFTLLWNYKAIMKTQYSTGHCNTNFKALGRFNTFVIFNFLLILIINRLLVLGYSIS